MTPTTSSALERFAWRAVEPPDLPGVQALLAAANAASGNPRAPALADLEREFEDEWSLAETDSRLALAADGTVVAFGRVYANPRPEDEARAFLDNDVHPAWRGRGLEDALLDWLETRGRAKLREIAAAAGFRGPRMLRGGTPKEDAQARAVFERHGFRPARYFYRMRRGLSQPLPDPPQLPAGLTVTPFRPELSAHVRDAFNEAFRDHWQPEHVSAADWQRFFVESSSFRPDLTRLVVDGGQVAAFSLNRVDLAESERQGHSTGWIGSLGTRRAWRKRGLATTLLVNSMRAFQAEGLQSAALGVDAENLTGALALYERLGFAAFWTSVAYLKDIAGDD
ncbi:MAG: GNAT family N-acetyltransferase [Anaerolineales bacterium]|nr:GNAT family N-acetyltransferase [Anaerolineales bacterium]